MRRLVWAALASAALGGCLPAPQRLRESTDPAHGAIVMAVSFKGREMPYWRRRLAQELFFQRVKPDGGLDAVLVPANFRVYDRLYVLDIPPGRYALTAAAYFTGRTRQISRLDPAIAAKLYAVDVRPGEIAFGGVAEINRFAGDNNEFWANGWRRLRQYLPPFKRAVVEVLTQAPPRLTRSPSAELETLRLARSDLSGTFWAEAVVQAMERLGNPPPTLLEGLLLKHAVERRGAKTFSYVDTLAWGEPRVVPGGLEWSRPRSHAWVSVVFVPRDGPGGRPLASVLRDLREVGAPEDTHTLAEIHISSRPAYAGRYTTYIYPEPALLGSAVTVFKTETVVVPAVTGLYKVQYRAEAAEFEKHRPLFEHFVLYIEFAPPKEKT